VCQKEKRNSTLRQRKLVIHTMIKKRRKKKNFYLARGDMEGGRIQNQSGAGKRLIGKNGRRHTRKGRGGGVKLFILWGVREINNNKRRGKGAYRNQTAEREEDMKHVHSINHWPLGPAQKEGRGRLQNGLLGGLRPIQGERRNNGWALDGRKE